MCCCLSTCFVQNNGEGEEQNGHGQQISLALVSILIADQDLDSSISHPEHQAGQPFVASLVTVLPVLSSALPAEHMLALTTMCMKI